MYIISLIIAAELLIWVCISLIIFSRYKLKNKPLSVFFFIWMIIINIILLILTAVDLKSGSTVTFAHGLAAIYIGISIAFGSQMIGYADRMYQNYFLKEHTPIEKPTKRQKLMTTLRHFLAYIIGAGLLYIMIQYIGNEQATGKLQWFIKIWTIVIAVDLGITIVALTKQNKTKKA